MSLVLSCTLPTLSLHQFLISLRTKALKGFFFTVREFAKSINYIDVYELRKPESTYYLGSGQVYSGLAMYYRKSTLYDCRFPRWAVEIIYSKIAIRTVTRDIKEENRVMSDRRRHLKLHKSKKSHKIVQEIEGKSQIIRGNNSVFATNALTIFLTSSQGAG